MNHSFSASEMFEFVPFQGESLSMFLAFALLGHGTAGSFHDHGSTDHGHLGAESWDGMVYVHMYIDIHMYVLLRVIYNIDIYMYTYTCIYSIYIYIHIIYIYALFIYIYIYIHPYLQKMMIRTHGGLEPGMLCYWENMIHQDNHG